MNEQWPDERTERLKVLWRQGLSASQIARVLGAGLTRNAVCGKLFRLGLASKPSAPVTAAKYASTP